MPKRTAKPAAPAPLTNAQKLEFFTDTLPALASIDRDITRIQGYIVQDFADPSPTDAIADYTGDLAKYVQFRNMMQDYHAYMQEASQDSADQLAAARAYWGSQSIGLARMIAASPTFSNPICAYIQQHQHKATAYLVSKAIESLDRFGIN